MPPTIDEKVFAVYFKSQMLSREGGSNAKADLVANISESLGP